MDYDLTLAGPEHVPALYAIMRRIATEIDPVLFVADDAAYLERHIAERGLTLMALNKDVVCAFQVVDFPGDSPENLGCDLDWPLAMRRAAAQMDSVCVLPEHRGHGLQKKLVAEAEKIVAPMGYRHFLSAVHPDNAPSLKSLLALGYAIGATKEKYGGVLRHILYKHAEN